LRADIAKYESISKYYERHVDDLEKMVFSEEERNGKLYSILKTMRE
jgi:hypothetical protein